jgi:PIN domain nuclease of toxin-antitoxin system
VISYWEVVLKSMKGQLEVGDPRTWWEETVDKLAAVVIPLRPKHISEIQSLPAVHKDPFDRVLIAQAATERLIILTTDRKFRRYEREGLRVIC